jgi:hypothetical protein
MELDELKSLWEQSERRFDAGMRLNAHLLERLNLGKVEGSLDRLVRGLTFELILNVPAILLIGAFAGDHAAEPRFLIPAIVLGVYAIAIAIAGVREIVALRSVRFDEPVVAIQFQLERARVGRITAVKWVMLSAPLLWVPLQIVALRALFGIDAYAAFGAAYLAANALFGVAFLALALWAARQEAWSERRSPFVRGLLDNLAGRSLTSALEHLDSLRRFEEEEAA